MVDVMYEELSLIEKEVYNLLKRSGEVITTQIPNEKAGAIPNLVNKGLVEVIKKRNSPRSNKKAKIVRVIDRSIRS